MIKTMRAFFAISLDDKTREAISQAINFLKGTSDGKKVRWSLPHHLHLTIRFLGDIQPSQTLSLKMEVQKALRKLPPFRLELGGISLFPNYHHPKVVVVDMAYSEALMNLFKAIEDACVSAGFPKELRPARPHITIGRLRENERHPPQFNFDLTPSKTGFLLNEVVLFQSVTRDKGTHYIPLEKIALSHN